MASQAYLLDTTPPASVAAISISVDTGPSAFNFITNTATQAISATLGAPLAASDRLYGSVDGGAHWTDAIATVVGTTVVWTGATLAQDANSIQFHSIDFAGNVGGTAS